MSVGYSAKQSVVSTSLLALATAREKGIFYFFASS